jgi:hypothetical protein
MTPNTVDVVRTADGKYTLKGVATPEFDALSALGPEAPRPLQLTVLQNVIGLRVREIAFAASVSEQSIRNWKRLDSDDRPQGYDDLRTVAERILRASAVDPKLIGSWFRSRNRGLGYTRPLEAIRAGDFARVMDVAESFIALSPPVGAPSPDEGRRQKDAFLTGRDIGEELAEHSSR